MTAIDNLAYLLLAQVSHGPGMHGGVIGLAVMAVAVIGVVVYVARRKHSANDAETDGGPETDAESDRGPGA
ncbi:MAG: hypothetical protein GEU88_08330 [Solirubrobacterales bacterium]|nr:hypothetical protein [Solirubrobacterales bacterium]